MSKDSQQVNSQKTTNDNNDNENNNNERTLLVDTSEIFVYFTAKQNILHLLNAEIFVKYCDWDDCIIAGQQNDIEILQREMAHISTNGIENFTRR